MENCQLKNIENDNSDILSFCFTGRINIVDLQQVCTSKLKQYFEPCVLPAVPCAICQQQAGAQNACCHPMSFVFIFFLSDYQRGLGPC